MPNIFNWIEFRRYHAMSFLFTRASSTRPQMAGPLLLRDVLFPHFRLHNDRRFVAGIAATETPHRILCCAPTNSEPGHADEKANYAAQISKLLRTKDLVSHPRLDDSDYRKWKDKEEDILKDIEPIVRLTKDILHSRRYMDGEQLTAEDEKAVVEKLLVYHPHSEDKIGCGLESIMVDRHPQFRSSRCLFVVRTDGGWIDFSYQKCLREYVRYKYPSHAERFIREHLKRGSG